MKEKKSNKIPPEIDNAFRNLEDIFYALTDKGWKDLDCEEAKKRRMKITNLGIQIQFKNRNIEIFSVIVTPNYLSDVNELRKEIVIMADAIREHFPEILEEKTIN